MSATPVTLTSVAQPTQARANLTAEQVTAFRGILDQAIQTGLITLPDGKTVADLVQFVMNLQPNGGGFLSVGIK